MKNNELTYQEKYDLGYGLQYPDGYFITVATQILEYQENIKNPVVLDYGCGNGIHLEYLSTKWPLSKLFGADISEEAIKQAHLRLPKHTNNLKSCNIIPNISELFPNQKFDLITSNQVLYYLDNPDLENIMNQLHDLLNPSGIIFITWMGVENFYYNLSEPIAGKSLRKVTLNNRLTETTEINFKNREQFSKLFDRYEKLHFGYYDSIIREDEGSTMHYTMVAKKKS